MTQVALAQALGLSPSYVNQLEQDQRPFTVSVLLKVHRILGVDIQQFSEDAEARLLAQLHDAVSAFAELPRVPQPELRELAAKLPNLSQVLLAMHRRHQEDMHRLEALADRLNDRRGDESIDDAKNAAQRPGAWNTLPIRQMPFEAVRDFFFAHKNYFDPLDRAAEALAQQARQRGGALTDWLIQYLRSQHGVHVLRVQTDTDSDQPARHRHFDAHSHTLTLSAHLQAGQQAFQLGTQLALLELGPQIEQLLHTTSWQDEATQRLARIGLANYVAGALILPYGPFLQAAENLHYDIDLLAQRFGVGFETVCHRLSTLQRPNAPGVPFFFIRVDRAGNISKRQSATHFHFSKTGGTCPLWNVYEAFAQPGRILPQLAIMPDGRVYLWIARTVTHEGQGWGKPGKAFSIGLGCDVQHATRLVYAKGLNLRSLEAATPIGMGCKVCERTICPQRAFPFVGKPLRINENESGFVPYGAAAFNPSP